MTDQTHIFLTVQGGIVEEYDVPDNIVVHTIDYDFGIDHDIIEDMAKKSCREDLISLYTELYTLGLTVDEILEMHIKIIRRHWSPRL